MAMKQSDADRSRLAAAEWTDRLLQYPNVFGCGVGQREVGGRRTGEMGLVVYVERKLPAGALRSQDILPREVHTSEGSVRVDVVERHRPYFGDDNNEYRPLEGGCRISATANGGSGTLGAVMYDRTDAEVVLLTCNHVLTPAGQRGFVPSNTTVSQPFMGQPIGTTKRIVPWLMPPLGDFGANLQARVDAGIVALDVSLDARFRVIGLGQHPYVPLPPHEGLEVRKRGFVTETTTGTVSEIDLTVVITDVNGQRVRIGGVGSGFSVRSPKDSLFFQRGDSGSLVVDSTGGAARGLMFAGDFMNGGLSYGCQLSAIMEQLQLETPCTGSLNAAFMRALRRRRLFSTVATLDTVRLTANITKFRARYLKAGARGSVAGAIEYMFQALGSELAEGLTLDEDFAGLIDIAIGDWLVQPTVFDMLEYQVPDDFHERLGRAFERFRQLNPDASGHEWLVPAFQGCGGTKMRDILARPASRQTLPKKRRPPAAAG